MDKDARLIFEAFINAKGDAGVDRPASKEEINVSKADLNKDKQLSDYELARAKAMDKAMNKDEQAENEPHGYPQGMTAVQNMLMTQLKKHGFKLTKISHADKDRDAYPTVFMMKSVGPMHNVAEIDGMGQINGEPYADYLKNLKNSAAQ
jgi:hypothetical protein